MVVDICQSNRAGWFSVDVVIHVVALEIPFFVLE